MSENVLLEYYCEFEWILLWQYCDCGWSWSVLLSLFFGLELPCYFTGSSGWDYCRGYYWSVIRIYFVVVTIVRIMSFFLVVGNEARFCCGGDIVLVIGLACYCFWSCWYCYSFPCGFMGRSCYRTLGTILRKTLVSGCQCCHSR